MTDDIMGNSEFTRNCVLYTYDSKDFIQESTISYTHQKYVVCYD